VSTSASGYETRVKVFLILVVLFLVTANLITVTFLIRSETSLVGEARARALSAAISIAAQADATGMVRRALGGEPGARSGVSADLYRQGRSHGASVVELVDASGRVIASSQTWRLGTVEPIETLLDAPAAAELRSGQAAVGAAGAELTFAFVPLARGAGEAKHFLRAGFELEAVEAISRQIHLLTSAQAVGGSVVLVMVLIFSRYVLRPYRELRAAAEALEAPGVAPAARLSASDDPGFLVASFRGVVEKMRSLEGELERMRRGGSSPGGQEGLLSSLSSGVLIIEEGGRVAALNPAGEEILGVAAAPARGALYGELFRASPELSTILSEALEHGRGSARQVVAYRHPSGRTVHLGVTVSGPPGGTGGALCLFSDLTEIRSVQDRVMLKENLARLGQLSAGIAHEFRNSLATILGYSRLAARERPEGDDNAQAIIREVKAMERVVGEFLRYAVPTRLQPGECDVREMVEALCRETLREGEDLRMEVGGEWPPSIQADETLLRQALHNLVRNAVEAALAGDPPRRVTVAGAVEGGGLSILIADSGAGFPPEVIESLFTPFVTTKERGTGLGMALAQKVIVGHDGSIEAFNDGGGGGGRVRVILPIS
jgi:nitrogen fixation/metabolism regulation signal transduction histidine kinase